MEEKENLGIAVIEESSLSIISKAEIDTQIATAKKYPRSITKFSKGLQEMATMTEEIAESCNFALPRAGKNITGASVRLAEMAASAWGNCRAGSRVVSEEAEHIVAQGIFLDLERNVAITREVKRRIIDKNGKRYNLDGITNTGNAACSIAMRNAIFSGIPKVFWNPAYEAALKVVKGDVSTLANRRAEALVYLQKFGVTPVMACAAVGVVGVEDIGLEQLVTLKGLITAVKNEEVTVEQAFPGPVKEGEKGMAGLKATLKTKDAGQAQTETPPPADSGAPSDPITKATADKLKRIASKYSGKGYTYVAEEVDRLTEGAAQDFHAQMESGDFRNLPFLVKA